MPRPPRPNPTPGVRAFRLVAGTSAVPTTLPIGLLLLRCGMPAGTRCSPCGKQRRAPPGDCGVGCNRRVFRKVQPWRGSRRGHRPRAGRRGLPGRPEPPVGSPHRSLRRVCGVVCTRPRFHIPPAPWCGPSVSEWAARTHAVAASARDGQWMPRPEWRVLSVDRSWIPPAQPQTSVPRRTKARR